MPSYLLLEDASFILLEDGSFLLTEEPGSYSQSAAIAGVGTIAGTGTRTAIRSATISGTGTIVAAAFKTVDRTATIIGTGTINATGEGLTPPRISALTGVGSHRLWQRSRSITLS